ncbi:DNA adenine methylase [Metabacillus indicus]|uniref:DNA adenine methylase n=1 Tax=Metabacillus indicus TaxID=246786 RepID=UPI0004937F54|nr:Dam family site-specific DNA-(adenine-N6)-methyltransferase [Metabacillus indicus]KEZ48205.1 DNA methyltransferase [Metabacillus indicus LMG 22858]
MNQIITPFLKWPGGKRWFIEKHYDLLPTQYNRYLEPFLGSGAVFFTLKPDEAILNDINKDLIDTYRGVKTRWRKVYHCLSEHSLLHSKEYYYDIRSSTYTSLEERSAQFIYLNRTCFNGIYRVNKKGKFNVPIGSKTRVLLDTDNFRAQSLALKKTRIFNKDFEDIIEMAVKDDFLFVDPPYTVRHNKNGFIKYNEILFTWEDQLRLSKSLARAKDRGVKIILTNASHESIRELYKPYDFNFLETSRYSSISATAVNRSNFEELIVMANL